MFEESDMKFEKKFSALEPWEEDVDLLILDPRLEWFLAVTHEDDRLRRDACRLKNDRKMPPRSIPERHFVLLSR